MRWACDLPRWGATLMMTVALSAFPCIDLSRVLRGWFAVLSGAKRRCEGATAFSVIALLVCLFAFCSSLITYRVSILLFASAIVLVAILAVRSGRLLEFDLRAIVPVLPWLLVAVPWPWLSFRLKIRNGLSLQSPHSSRSCSFLPSRL